MLKIIDFAESKVFEAITEPCVLIVSKSSGDGYSAEFIKWDQTRRPESIHKVFAANSQKIPLSKLQSDGWRLESPAVLRLLEKLRAAGTPLGEYCNGRFYYGIKTGLNDAFMVNRATRDRLIAEHPSSADVLKPFLRRRDVKRWRVDFADQYLIKIESSENKTHPWTGKLIQNAEDVYAATYPAIHAFHQKFRNGLIKRADQGKYFWELRSCAYWQEFGQPKIIYQDIARYFGMAWDDSGCYLANTCYFIPCAKKWVLAILLSDSMFYFVKKIIGSEEGGFIRLFSIHVKNFPIPIATPIEQIELEKIVQRILENPNAANVADLETEINERVYRLYGLTRDEITVIEAEH